MKLKELTKYLNECVKKAGDTDPSIEIYLEEEGKLPIFYDIKRIGQFSIVPDVTLELQPFDFIDENPS